MERGDLLELDDDGAEYDAPTDLETTLNTIEGWFGPPFPPPPRDEVSTRALKDTVRIATAPPGVHRRSIGFPARAQNITALVSPTLSARPKSHNLLPLLV